MHCDQSSPEKLSAEFIDHSLIFVEIGSHTQVACICQLLSAPDYNIIFKTLQENYMNDDLDDYYECIWDLALLEILISTSNREDPSTRLAVCFQIIWPHAAMKIRSV